MALGLKQLTDDPWSRASTTYEVGQVYPGRVTRLAEFGAFVELEPGIEGLAHVSTFPPVARSEQWSRSVPVGTTGAFEILSVEPEKRRIGVALVPEGSGRGAGAAAAHGAPQDADELREYTDSQNGAAREGLGSLADKLRGALTPRGK